MSTNEPIPARALHRSPTPAGEPGSLTLLPIIGRDEDIDIVLALLDDPEAGLVSLVGPGGVGKTRLALEVARRANHRFAHGARVISLGSLMDPDVLPAELARGLDLPTTPGTPLLDQVTAALAVQHMLLVLDNLEQLAEGVEPMISHIRRGCPRVKILVTSRVALRLTGERRYAVPPLAVSHDDLDPTIDRGPAVALFLRQARAVRPDLDVTHETLTTIASICRAVDGLPLAIELAASRVRHLPPAAILARIDRRLDLLQRAAQGTPARHQSLRATIAWSVDLLPGPARHLFRVVAAFTGGFTIDALRPQLSHAGTSGPPATILHDLETLVEHHLVRPAGDDEGVRFTMLETIREYAVEDLALSGYEREIRDAHASTYHDLALALGPQAWGPHAGTVVPHLRAEWANIRSAARWLASRGRADEAVAMYSELHTFLLRDDHAEEARTDLDAWAADARIGDQARSVALMRSAHLSIFLHEHTPACALLPDLVAYFRATGDHKHLAKALVATFPITNSPDDLARAVANCREGLPIALEHGDLPVACWALQFLTWDHASRGEQGEAEACARRMLDIARSGGMRLMEAGAMMTLADALGSQGRMAEAKDLLHQAATIYWSEADIADFHLAQLHLADIALDEGDPDLARGLLEPVARHMRADGRWQSLVPVLDVLARAELSAGDGHAALRLAQECLALQPGEPAGYGSASAFGIVAWAAARDGDMRRASLLLGVASAVLRRSPVPHDQAPPLDAAEQAERTARTALGDDAFAAAFMEGTSMSGADAVVLALAFRGTTITGAVPLSPVARAGLSSREQEVLRLMCDGLGNNEISLALGMSAHTARAHVSRILDRLGVTSRTAAVAWAIRHGVA